VHSRVACDNNRNNIVDGNEVYDYPDTIGRILLTFLTDGKAAKEYLAFGTIGDKRDFEWEIINNGTMVQFHNLDNNLLEYQISSIEDGLMVLSDTSTVNGTVLKKWYFYYRY